MPNVWYIFNGRGNRRVIYHGPMDTLDALMAAVDPAAARPLYKQIAQALRDLVTEGALAPEDPLPTEKEICQALGVGRSTVRAALTALVEEGMVTRRAGKGTFVAPATMRRTLNSLYDFSGEVRAAGMEPTTRVLSFSVEKPCQTVADALGIPIDEDVFRVERLRLADSVVMSLETSYLPCRLFSGLSADDVTGSLYAALAQGWGVEAAQATEIYESVLLGKREAELLGRASRSAAFRITRTAADGHGRPFEMSNVVAPGDHTRFSVQLKRDGVSWGPVA